MSPWRSKPSLIIFPLQSLMTWLTRELERPELPYCCVPLGLERMALLGFLVPEESDNNNCYVAQ